jgi:hypothetical protein
VLWEHEISVRFRAPRPSLVSVMINTRVSGTRIVSLILTPETKFMVVVQDVT